MKRLLLAVLMATGIGAVQAQSSVSVYGILDVGFSGLSTRGADSTIANSATPATNAINNTKVTNTQIGSGYDSTSRLGFRGVEDLGSGTTAFFTAEMGLVPTDSTSYSAMTNRQTFVGLGQTGLGKFAVGTQYTPVFNAMTATNPGANNTVVGSIIYPASSTQGTTTISMTTRTNNTLTVQSDSFAGFRANAMYTANNTDQTQTATTGGNTNKDGYGLGVDYTWNKLYVTAAYQSFKAVTDTAATNAALTALTANSTDNQTFVGATYDFGILKAYANYVNRKATSGLNSNAYFSRSGEQLGIRANITPRVEAWASAGVGNYKAFGQGEPTANFNAWQIGSNYNLSKRTNLYAIYGQTQTSATTTVAGATTSAAASQYAVGMRHTF